MRLTISRALIKQIRAEAVESPDREICGLLLGRGDSVDRLVACANVAADPSDSFEIDPRALIAAHRAARGDGPAVIGHYHSHPRGAARPSARDAGAAEPGCFWIVIGGEEMTAWYSRQDPVVGLVFAPVEIVSRD